MQPRPLGPVLLALPDGSYRSEVATHKARSIGFKVPFDAVGDPRNGTHIRVRVIGYLSKMRARHL